MNAVTDRWWQLGLILTALLSTKVASAASPEETAAARAAAQAGVESFERSAFAEALDRFERAESLVHAPTHLLYQARCYERLGNLVRARELYIKLARELLPADAPPVFRETQKHAQAELPAIEARVPYVTIVVKGASTKDAAVTVDGVAVPKAILGLPYPVNPGLHQLEAKTPNGSTATASLKIDEGKRATVELLLDAGSETAPVAKPAQPVQITSSPTRDQGHSSWMKPVGYVTIGAGVVGGALGTVMYLQGASKRSDADEAFDQCTNTCSAEELSHVVDLDKQARSAGVVAAVGFAVGGVALATGITLLVLAPTRSETVALAPFIGPNSAGLVGQF